MNGYAIITIKLRSMMKYKLYFCLLFLVHCATFAKTEEILLDTDLIMENKNETLENYEIVFLTKESEKYQKCHINNTIYSDSIFVSFHEFAENIKSKYPESNGIKDFDISESVRQANGNIFYRVFYLETCFHYSGFPIILKPIGSHK